jgi:two-component system sensor histidine kinase KdpD
MGKLSPAQAELVALIDEQASLLNELTTKLLTTARLEAGEGETALALHIEPVNAAEMIDEVVAGIGERSAGSTILVKIEPRGLTIPGDARLLSMLLTQYLDNACKYSDADSAITVRAERTEKEILLSVHSFGAVIPLADRERIFDRYFRSSASATRAAGTGIGLSIAKRAAQAHGGSVWVSSDDVEGTTFFAAIPAVDSTADSTAVVPAKDKERKRK